MRSPFGPALFLFATAFFTTGCPSTDPDLDRPCGERAPREVEVGTGEQEFEPLTDKVSVYSGPQGGTHIWVAVRTQNLGPTVTVAYGVVDPESGQSLSEEHLKQIVELEYTGVANEAAGLQAFLKDEAQVTGTVRLWAEVVDECGVPTRGERDAVVDDGR